MFARRIIISSFIIILFGCNQESTHISDKSLYDSLKQLSDSLDKNHILVEETFWLAKYQEKKYQHSNPSLAFIEYHLGRIYLIKTDLEKSEKYIKLALNRIEETQGNEELKFKIYSTLGYHLYNAKNKLYLSIYYCNKATYLIQKGNIASDINYQIRALLNAAEINHNAKQIQRAIEQDNHALFLLNKYKSDSYWDYTRAYSQLFYNYGNMENIDISILEQYLAKIENIAKNNKGCDEDIERLYFKSKADYLCRIKAYKDALVYHNKVLEYDLKEYSNNLNAPYTQKSLFETHINFFKIYIQQKNKQKALETLHTIQSFIPQRLPLNDFEQEIFLSWLIEYYFLLEDLEQVKKYSKELYHLKSKILTLGIQAIEEIATSFELKAKNKEILSLHQDISNTHLKLKKSEIIVLITLLVTLILVFWIITIYFLYERKKQKQKMEKIILEQRLLQVQMEPHFIFNTLSVLQGFIRSQDTQKSLKYLHQFSKLLRSSLELSRTDFISLAEEIKLLNNYIILQQMHWTTPFKYSIQYKDIDIDHILIPPMLIQPFVENSIKHGFNKKKEDSEIIIHFKKDDDYLYIEVVDNGENNYKSNQNHHSLAINITKERLKLLSKDRKKETNITINQTDKGYCVTIKLFLEYKV